MGTTSWELLRPKRTPSQQRKDNRRIKIWRIQSWMFTNIPWMGWPILQYIYSFWCSIFEEGIKDTCQPRWGHVTFGWLNDGMKPTLWHTWRQLTHDHVDDKYTGIYPGGAPKSLKQAEEWEKKWTQKREQEEVERLMCDDCYRTDGTHDYEIEH